MNYELAKQLKDAGFPQNGAGKRIAPPEKIVVRRDDFAYLPTLEELIEACGQRIEGVLQQSGKWCALDAKEQDGPKLTPHRGSTPVEAVARLWLALDAPSASVTGE